jgi:hypothetical protein
METPKPFCLQRPLQQDVAKQPNLQTRTPLNLSTDIVKSNSNPDEQKEKLEKKLGKKLQGKQQQQKA